MEISLTKDADKAICLIYKEYLSKREAGLPKRAAKDFSDRDKWPKSFSSELGFLDFLDTLKELKENGFIKMFIGGGFQIEDIGIVYMEQRFPNGIAQVLDWHGKIKSVIPFV